MREGLSVVAVMRDEDVRVAECIAFDHLDPSEMAQFDRHEHLKRLFTQNVMKWSGGFVDMSGGASDDLVEDFKRCCGWFAHDVAQYVLARWTALQATGTKRRYDCDKCPLCLEYFKDDSVALPCEHCVHSDCWQDYVAKSGWGKSCVACVICRKELERAFEVGSAAVDETESGESDESDESGESVESGEDD